MASKDDNLSDKAMIFQGVNANLVIEFTSNFLFYMYIYISYIKKYFGTMLGELENLQLTYTTL